MKRVAAVVAGIALLASVTASAAGGQAPPPGRTIVLTELAKGGTFRFIDNPPKARPNSRRRAPRLSVGDFLVFSGALANQQGSRVGRVHVQCVVSVAGTPRAAEQVCTGVFALRDGQIGVAAVLVGEARTVTAIVTGGTGAYEGARGTLTSVSHRDNTSTDTLHLLP